MANYIWGTLKVTVFGTDLLEYGNWNERIVLSKGYNLRSK